MCRVRYMRAGCPHDRPHQPPSSYGASKTAGAVSGRRGSTCGRPPYWLAPCPGLGWGPSQPLPSAAASLLPPPTAGEAVRPWTKRCSGTVRLRAHVHKRKQWSGRGGEHVQASIATAGCSTRNARHASEGGAQRLTGHGELCVDHVGQVGRHLHSILLTARHRAFPTSRLHTREC